jgi:hypothetical protein
VPPISPPSKSSRRTSVESELLELVKTPTRRMPEKLASLLVETRLMLIWLSQFDLLNSKSYFTLRHSRSTNTLSKARPRPSMLIAITACSNRPVKAAT